ncbi:MAG: polyprenyl synthetase family protein [Clostridia bacterium]|nr:polyprenyl synthetase family protein [Oscillospiraceae bacterium]MBQ2829031.1 polyprenyl synthetase family protein [Clostridia bacterium]
MIERTLDSYLALIEDYLDNSIDKSCYDEEIVADAMRYSLQNGGKRIRPVLVLEFCRLCGGDVKKALPFAAAIEMIHTYSLIHDDLPCMDDDDMRRGKPSCHKKFGEEYALLAGDGLLTLAFEMLTKAELSDSQKVSAVKALSLHAGYQGMIGGQTVDLMSEGKAVSLDRLKTMDNLKTGKLINCAALLGCIAANADAEKTEHALIFTGAVGLAFQIVDDILDVTSTEEKLGKPIGSDSEKEKSTYVSLLGIEKSKEYAEELTGEAVNALSYFGDDAEFLKNLALKLLERDN